MKLLGRHNEVVSLLLERLDELAEHKDVPSVVVIEGASGTGKTAIIQEFYERLKDARGDEYWPAHLAVDAADVSSKGSPFATRKRVSPNLDNFVWPAGVLPRFGWFGFDCQRLSDGSTYDVISAARPQLRAHMLPLTLASDEKLGRMRKLKKLVGLDTRDFYEAIADEAEGVLTDAALEALGAVVPGLGLFTSLSKKSAQKLYSAKQEKDALKSEVRIGDKTKEDKFVAATELAESICAVAQQSLPVIITIEDVHLMGEEMKHFLGRLEENRAWKDLPILVVATAWPEGRKNITYVEWLAEGVDYQRVEVVSVPEFDLDSGRTLLREYAPGTEEAVLDTIVAKLVTPFAIKLWVTQGKIQRVIRRNDGAIVLSDEVSVPSSLKELIRERWNELDSEVQAALTLAVAVNPIDNDDTAEFIREVVAQTPGELGDLSETELLDAFVRAYKPINWCRFEDDLSSFTEPFLAQQARENSNEEFDVEDIRELRAQALKVLAAWISDHEDEGMMQETDVNLNAARWFIALNGEPTGETSDDLLRVQIIATATIASALAASYKYSEAIDLVQNVLVWPKSKNSFYSMWSVRHYLASWLSEVGRYEEAIEQLKELLNDLEREFYEDHPNILVTRATMASTISKIGCVDEAIEQYEVLLEDCRRVFGVYHPSTLVVRSNLSSKLGAAGRLDEAIEQYEVLLEDCRRVFGVYHSSTLVVRSNLAKWLGEAGRFDEAISQYEGLFEECQQALGALDPITLTVGDNLAGLLGTVGRVDQALELFGRTLEGRRRVLGDEHPDTLTTWNNLAGWCGVAGRVDEAIEQYEKLIEDCRRLMGEWNHLTVQVHQNMAFCIFRSGRVDEATEYLERLLDRARYEFGGDYSDTLTRRNLLCLKLGGNRPELVEAMVRLIFARGENHPDTLRALFNFVLKFADSGRVDEVVALHKLLLDDFYRVLGEVHLDTLAARNNFITWLGEGGHFDEAVRQSAQLVDDCHRFLGNDHPSTLRVRSNFAALLSDAARIDEAIEQYEILLDIRRRVLGEGHADTQQTRLILANRHARSGHIEQVIEQYEILLEIRQRVLGEDHLETLEMRNDLASILAKAGRIDEAIKQYKELLEIQRRVLGEDHAETLDSRGNLASVLGAVGRAREAFEQFATVFEYRQRVLGENHPDTLMSHYKTAYWLAKAGYIDQAILLFQELLEKECQVFGEDHLNTLTTRSDLASLLVESDRLDEALEQYVAIHDHYCRVLGEDHQDTLWARSSVASLLARSGHIDEAIELFEGLVEDHRRVLGRDAPGTLIIHNNLANWLGIAGRVDEAVKEYESLLAERSRVSGEDHPETLKIRARLNFWRGQVDSGK